MGLKENIESFYDKVEMGIALATGVITLACAEIAVYNPRVEYNSNVAINSSSIDKDRLYRWLKIEYTMGAVGVAGISLTRLAKKRKLEELAE